MNTLRNSGISANVDQIQQMITMDNMTPQQILSSFGIVTPTIDGKTTSTSVIPGMNST